MIEIAPGIAVSDSDGTTINGLSVQEFSRQNKIWQDHCHRRIDSSLFDLDKLVHTLCHETWMRHCEIIPDYMPPFPAPHTQPKVVVKWTDPADETRHQFLRHSKGPFQGTDWDSYGDDFHTPELALLMLSRSLPPRGAGNFSFTAYPLG